MTPSVLVVGLGQIGMGYDLALPPEAHVFTHARAFQRDPGFALVAGVDPDAGRRETFTRVFGCPAYDELAMALEAHLPSLVVIAGPTPLHLPMVRAALALPSTRCIVCEKPLAYDLAEARAIVEECEAAGVALFVNYMRRSDPGVVEIRRRLESGAIATPVKGVAWYSKGFLHNGSHFFNLLEYWLGPMQGATVLDRGRLWDGYDPEPDVQVRFADGTIVFLAAREEAFSHYAVELLSTSGQLRYEQGGERIEWRSSGPDPHFAGYTILQQTSESIATGMDRYQSHVVAQLGRALAGQDAQLCSGRDALQTLVSMHSLMEYP